MKYSIYLIVFFLFVPSVVFASVQTVTCDASLGNKIVGVAFDVEYIGSSGNFCETSDSNFESRHICIGAGDGVLKYSMNARSDSSASAWVRHTDDNNVVYSNPVCLGLSDSIFDELTFNSLMGLAGILSAFMLFAAINAAFLN